jgi:two-component system response regulator
MNPGKILLVEDNEDDQLLCVKAFKKNNMLNEIVIANDGEEAVQILSDKTLTPPALILLDLKLPKLSGIEVLQKIRADDRLKFIPVVVLTSSRELKDLQNAYLSGANSYICKPIDFNEFSDSVLEVGLYWLSLNESLSS